MESTLMECQASKFPSDHRVTITRQLASGNEYSKDVTILAPFLL